MYFKILLSVSIIISCTNILYAQLSIPSAGLTISNSYGNISYTVGQVDYISTPIGNLGTLSEGVQQVYNALPFTYIVNIDRSTTLSVWPNPVIDNLNIKINRGAVSGISYQLMSMNGQLIENKKTFSSEIKVDTHNYAVGTYILSVKLPNQAPIQFKIIKQ